LKREQGLNYQSTLFDLFGNFFDCLGIAVKSAQLSKPVATLQAIPCRRVVDIRSSTASGTRFPSLSPKPESNDTTFGLDHDRGKPAFPEISDLDLSLACGRPKYPSL